MFHIKRVRVFAILAVILSALEMFLGLAGTVFALPSDETTFYNILLVAARGAISLVTSILATLFLSRSDLLDLELKATAVLVYLINLFILFSFFSGDYPFLLAFMFLASIMGLRYFYNLRKGKYDKVG
jgi:hypothetical protein